jgi:hypothetical protein
MQVSSSGHLDLENSLSTEDSSLTLGGGNFTIEAWVNVSVTLLLATHYLPGK